MSPSSSSSSCNQDMQVLFCVFVLHLILNIFATSSLCYITILAVKPRQKTWSIIGPSCCDYNDQKCMLVECIDPPSWRSWLHVEWSIKLQDVHQSLWKHVSMMVYVFDPHLSTHQTKTWIWLRKTIEQQLHNLQTSLFIIIKH